MPYGSLSYVASGLTSVDSCKSTSTSTRSSMGLETWARSLSKHANNFWQNLVLLKRWSTVLSIIMHWRLHLLQARQTTSLSSLTVFQSYRRTCQGLSRCSVPCSGRTLSNYARSFSLKNLYKSSGEITFSHKVMSCDAIWPNSKVKTWIKKNLSAFWKISRTYLIKWASKLSRLRSSKHERGSIRL